MLRIWSLRLGLFCWGIAVWLSSASLLQGASDWIIHSAADVRWTNKPLHELRAEAGQGNAVAQFYYARACFHGQDRERDLTESFHWLEKAAEQNYADAQALIARFYFTGTGTARNPKLGFPWAVRAAEKNHPEGLALVADAYTRGLGTERDAAKAVEFFWKAIEAGSVAALDRFGHFYLEGEAGTATRTNYTAALQLFERAASNGLAHAATHLIEFYTKGLGTPPNFSRAVHWARVFADRDDPEMLLHLAGFYAKGQAEPRGPHDAPTILYRRAAELRAASAERPDLAVWSRRDSSALINTSSELWNRYRFGIGTARDYISAAQWMWQAWHERQRPLQFGPGPRGNSEEYVFEPIVSGTLLALSAEERLWHEAVRWIDRALTAGEPEAFAQIAEMYREGSALTPQSPALAWAWHNRAFQSGHEPSREALAELEPELDPETLAQARRHYIPDPNKARKAARQDAGP